MLMKITTMLLKASGYIFLVFFKVSSITIFMLCFRNTSSFMLQKYIKFYASEIHQVLCFRNTSSFMLQKYIKFYASEIHQVLCFRNTSSFMLQKYIKFYASEIHQVLHDFYNSSHKSNCQKI